MIIILCILKTSEICFHNFVVKVRISLLIVTKMKT